MVKAESFELLLAALTEPPFKRDEGKTYLMFDKVIVTTAGTKFFYEGKEVFFVTPENGEFVAFGCVPFTLGE